MTDVDRFADGEVVYHVSEKGTIRRGTCDGNSTSRGDVNIRFDDGTVRTLRWIDTFRSELAANHVSTRRAY
ncbi:hypothetical protein CPT_MyoSmar_048 [Serratia phage MyoSmar]|uniref:Uncharacterized protein n=3 Tax=Myosmarvirus TaxID=2843428 RepID=A0A9E8G0R2_9CAUD|nr:hypothetical protein HWC56_gp048 [Serratia phage MyoSmar]QEG09497.1 hypothetical protein CPT_MyoSmar_048 [Serratia phage MyoSmar]UZS00347.1 hypothetical protein [Serratia phage SMP]